MAGPLFFYLKLVKTKETLIFPKAENMSISKCPDAVNRLFSKIVSPQNHNPAQRL